jgi:hypothetical protein
MRYEIFLRAAAPITAELVEEVRAANPDLSVDPYSDEAGALMGLDLGADLEDPAAARLLLKAAIALSEGRGLRMYDPQLSRPITEADREQVTEQMERTSAFMQSLPVSTAGQSLAGEQAGMSATTRLWMMIGGAMLLALLASQGLTCMFKG